MRGKRAIIFDDEIASGGSIMEVTEALQKLGVSEIEACCVHAVLSGRAVERLQNSALKKLVVTDTVYIPPEKKFSRLEIISVAELFAKAILYTHQGDSISGLYDQY